MRGHKAEGGLATMSYLFAAVMLLSSPGCPHEEPTCLTPTEYVEVNLRLGSHRAPAEAPR
jgi:predicted metal-binding protein